MIVSESKVYISKFYETAFSSRKSRYVIRVLSKKSVDILCTMYILESLALPKHNFSTYNNDKYNNSCVRCSSFMQYLPSKLIVRFFQFVCSKKYCQIKEFEEK